MYRKKIKQKICQVEDMTNLINQRINTPKAPKVKL